MPVLFAFVVLIAQGFTIPPTPDHYVTDNAGALNDATRAWIENDLQAYEKQTGHQIVVWIAQSTNGVPLETFTGETADRWKIGRKGHDDGAVLFVFMRDRKVRIEVGYGLEGRLTDADSYRIIQDVILPKMRAGDPNAAISYGVDAMTKTITPSFQSTAPTQQNSPVDNEVSTIGWIIFGFLGWVILMLIVREIRYGILVMEEGPDAARRDMRRTGRGIVFLGGLGGGGFGGGGFGGGFSAGGGGFGGGGASGGW